MGQTRRGYDESREREVDSSEGGGSIRVTLSLRALADAEPAETEKLAADQGQGWSCIQILWVLVNSVLHPIQQCDVTAPSNSFDMVNFVKHRT